jgi:GNAT superfamily N-acetyltransferase
MKIRIRPIAPSECDLVAEMVAHVFAEREVLALQLGLTRVDMTKFCKPLMEAGRAEFSLVAFDEDQDTMAGALIAETFSCPEPEWDEHTRVRMQPILAFLDDADNRFFAGSSIPRDQVFHEFMLATASDYSGRGIATSLVRESNKLARHKGFKYCLAETTGPISRRILVEKLGYREQLVIAYDSAGGLLAGLGASKFCSVVMKEL